MARVIYSILLTLTWIVFLLAFGSGFVLLFTHTSLHSLVAFSIAMSAYNSLKLEVLGFGVGR